MTLMLSWASCALSIAAIYFAGKKSWWAWLIYLLNLAPLVIINWKLRLWGFMPLNLIAGYMYIKNARQWKRGEK